MDCYHPQVDSVYKIPPPVKSSPGLPSWCEPDDSLGSERFFVSLQGPVLRMGRSLPPSDDWDGGAPDRTRGIIETFSDQSRSKLLRKLSTVDFVGMERVLDVPVCVTLTYPREYPVNPAVWKEHLRAFRVALERKAQARPVVIWKLEPQERGAPHTHMLIWGAAFLGEMAGKRWLSAVWYRIVRSGDVRHLKAGTGVTRFYSPQGFTYYLCKYITKLEKGARLQVFPFPVGRYWGVWNESSLLFLHREVLEFTRPGYFKLRRLLVRMYKARKRARGQRWARFKGDQRMCVGMWTLLPPVLVERLLLYLGDDVLEWDCVDYAKVESLPSKVLA